MSIDSTKLSKKDDAVYIQNMYAVIKGIAEPQIRRDMLQKIIEIARELGISIPELDEIKSEISSIPVVGSDYLEEQRLKTRLGERERLKADSILDAVCDLFGNSVSEQTKQRYLNTGMQFNSLITNTSGMIIQPIQVLRQLGNGLANAAAVTARGVQSLNNFVKSGNPAIAAAKEFDAACRQFSKEARSANTAGQKPKSWVQLTNQQKIGLSALEATRLDAGRLIAAEKRISVIDEILAQRKALEAKNPVKESGIETESVAMNILKNLRESKTRGRSR